MSWPETCGSASTPLSWSATIRGYTCGIIVTVIGGDDDDDPVDFDEFDNDGRVRGGRRHSGGSTAFGTVSDVITALSRRPPGDPWVTAVVAALDRDRTWDLEYRRPLLD